ncbi:MAG: ribbon-helix-helix protein, CopG family [Candidatus Dormibacteraeota bacterium]|nr:ribbon-helix-helix protein, CopG family [Candidatus Dormibacteraeota bacterium]
MEKTTLYLSPELQRELREASKRLGRSQADVIRAALSEYLRSRPRPRPRSIGVAASGAVPAASSEDWIHRRWSQRSGER